MGNYYLLDENNVPYEVTLEEFAESDIWVDRKRNTVARNEFGDVLVSTVFLGIDHSFGMGESAPILFETMILGGEYDGYQIRCSDWNTAQKHHNQALELITSKS